MGIYNKNTNNIFCFKCERVQERKNYCYLTYSINLKGTKAEMQGTIDDGKNVS